MTEPKKLPTPEKIAAALDLGNLDRDLLDVGPLGRSFDAVEAMSEDEFIEIAEDALPWLTDEQKAMLRQNR
jgi:hypothetical protein